MEIINKTNKKVEIEFGNTIIGTERESIDWIVKMMEYDELFVNQDKVWSILNNERIDVLKKLGFFKENNHTIKDDNGKVIFQNSISEYQKSKGLQATGILDKKTEELLYKDYLRLLTE